MASVPTSALGLNDRTLLVGGGELGTSLFRSLSSRSSSLQQQERKLSNNSSNISNLDGLSSRGIEEGADGGRGGSGDGGSLEDRTLETNFLLANLGALQYSPSMRGR